MKLNVNKIIISGNNLLPFYFLPHALNISLFMIAVVNGQDLPRLPFGICEVTNIFWKIKRFSLSAKYFHNYSSFSFTISNQIFNASTALSGSSFTFGLS